jgi:hypothetical protein
MWNGFCMNIFTFVSPRIMRNKPLFWKTIFLLLTFSVSYYSCVKDVAPLPRASVVLCTDIKYSVHIQPILQAECINPGCHSVGGGSSGYDLSTYAFVKAKVDDSTFVHRVLQGDVYGWMPTTGALPLDERQKINCWIKNGALNN